LGVSTNENFDIDKYDIRAAFLQSENLDREIHVEPPKDLKEEGKLWKLVKPLYGLQDASRKFWLKVKKVLKKYGLLLVIGDEAFYYIMKNGRLVGMILTHVDDFFMSGTKAFLIWIGSVLNYELQVSKVEKNKFRFTGIDVEKVMGGIRISMNEYADSLENIENIRDAKNDELLTKTELSLYRKFTGKIA
jgi:hypothetical protein